MLPSRVSIAEEYLGDKRKIFSNGLSVRLARFKVMSLLKVTLNRVSLK